MSTCLFGVLVDGLNKPIINATVTLLARQNTLNILNGSEAIFRTDAAGFYNITVQSGHYNVIIGPQGIEPYKAGEIALYADSEEGSLNAYLVNWVPEELTPEVIKEVQDLVARSEAFALDAGRSASSANLDATDARGSKAASQSAAAEALVYKNDAKSEADAAKLAQQGASGSANTATQAVATVQSLKSDVEQLKSDTQTIKDSAITDISSATNAGVSAIGTAKTDAIAEITPLKEAAEGAAALATQKATEAAGSVTTAEQKAATATSEADRSKTEADRAATESANAKGWKYERNLMPPAGYQADKYYPVIFKEKNLWDMSKLGVFFQISTRNESGDYPYNSTSFAGYARTSGWSDGADSVYGNFTIYQSAERTIECIALPSQLTTSCFAVYVQGGAFPINVHCENNVDIIVPDADYAPDGFVEHATVFKFGAADPTAESTKVKTMGLTRSGFYANNDYAIRNVDGFKDSLEIGPNQIPRFTSLDLIRLNSPELSGILHLHARGADPNTSLGYGRVYAEKMNGIWRTTFHTANNEANRHSYIQHDEYGNIHNVFNLYPVNVDATGFIRGGGGSSVGLKTKDGGKKDILLYNLEGDGDTGYMVNQMQGWFYGSSYQIGGVRSGGASLDSVDVMLNSFSRQ